MVVDRSRTTRDRRFNAASEEFEDLMKAGIMDPTKVVRSALQNAASVASLLLTTDHGGGEARREGRRRYAEWDASGRHDVVAQANTRCAWWYRGNGSQSRRRIKNAWMGCWTPRCRSSQVSRHARELRHKWPSIRCSAPNGNVVNTLRLNSALGYGPTTRL